MAANVKAVETWGWVLIYGGLGLLSLGLFVPVGQGGLGLALMLAGGVAALAGAALIYLRSTLPDDKPNAKERP